MLVAISIVAMQLYKFYQSQEVLDLFNTLSSMVLGAYFRWKIDDMTNKKEAVTNKLPEEKTNEPHSENDNDRKPILDIPSQD